MILRLCLISKNIHAKITKLHDYNQLIPKCHWFVITTLYKTATCYSCFHKTMVNFINLKLWYNMISDSEQSPN